MLSSWGAGLFVFPHTIRADAQDNLWIVDRDHGQMFYFSPSGSLLRTVGTRGYRHVGAVVCKPIGESGSVTVAVEHTEWGGRRRHLVEGVGEAQAPAEAQSAGAHLGGP